jgi:diguanylate cyclase (GGDEF)-like protein
MDRASRRLGLSNLPPRLRWYVGGVVALAVPIVAAAAGTATPPSTYEALWLGGFLALAFLADLKPVPLDEDDGHAVSLAFVFILASLLLFGWQYAVLIGVCSIVSAQLIERRPPTRLVFNGATYALAALAAAVPTVALDLDDATGVGAVTISAFVGGALFVIANVALVCGAVALQQGVSVRSLLRDNARHSAPAFVIMAFIAALATTLYRQEPVTLLLLAGPMVALTMYQRSALATRIAARAALTDDLTGLGNRRSYESGLREAIERAEQTGMPLSLCVVDVDSFKQINDVYGHPAGDGVLVALAEILSAAAPAFRLGGDELALALELDAAAAYAAIERLQERVAGGAFQSAIPVTISAGIASYPAHAVDVTGLERAADDALYAAKHEGRSRTRVYAPALARTFPPHELARRVEREARLRAAENLVRVVDAKDTYVGAHSASVARVAAEIAHQLGLDEEEIANVQLAARLHDLGKIAIPDRILQKPEALTFDEARLMRTHPELGASLLDGLEIGPVDRWIRHHHEHWDGSGYPDRLSAEDIPLGSRIILVADAFDAMTSNRSYRPAMSVDGALAELCAKAASQFDPEVVGALLRWIGVAELPEQLGCDVDRVLAA